MITVRIGDSERELHSANESWIIEQISRRREDGQSVCVRVIISEGLDINIILSTPGCPNAGASSRRPNSKEKEIFDLWDRHGLHKNDFSGGHLISFLKQIRHRT